MEGLGAKGTVPFGEQSDIEHEEKAVEFERRFLELTGQQIMHFCDSGSPEDFAEGVRNLQDSQTLDALQDWLARKLILAERELAAERGRSGGGISVSYTNNVQKWQQRLEVVKTILREANSQM